MNTFQLVQYYVGLLIIQYIGKLRAAATIETQVTPVIMPQTSVQTISFSPIPTGGTFLLGWNGVDIVINWNDSAATIQSKLRNLPLGIIDGGNAASSGPTVLDGGNASTAVFFDTIDGGNAFGWSLGGIVVTGSIASGLLTVTFNGVTPVAPLMTIDGNSLTPSPITVTITEIDLTLPLAVQAAFNLNGSSLAQGKQLDVIGKYAGVARSGNGFTGPITLNDADFLQLIQMAIIRNNSGSSLATIQDQLHQFFPSEILVFDSKNMQISYLISTALSTGLVQLFVTEGLLPKPMGVGLAVIYVPMVTNLFGFRTYELPAFNVEPFNNYSSYQTNWPWLSYADAIVV